MEPHKQAVVIVNYVRTLNSLKSLYWHSALQNYGQWKADNALVSCGMFLKVKSDQECIIDSISKAGSDITSYGYAYSTISCRSVSSTTADPGTIVQGMVDSNEDTLISPNFNEIGFGFNATKKTWRYTVGKRTGCKKKHIQITQIR